jgi:hypothetical protein
VNLPASIAHSSLKKGGGLRWCLLWIPKITVSGPIFIHVAICDPGKKIREKFDGQLPILVIELTCGDISE